MIVVSVDHIATCHASNGEDLPVKLGLLAWFTKIFRFVFAENVPVMNASSNAASSSNALTPNTRNKFMICRYSDFVGPITVKS